MKAIDRIYQYIDYKSIKVVDFEKKNSISNGYLAKMKSRGAGIGEDILNQILENSPEVSPEWLLTGNGKMLRSAMPLEKLSEIGRGVPLIPLEAMAGLPSTDNLGVRFEDCDHYNVPEFEKNGVEYMVRVSGSSMYPKYSNGDVLACRRITELLFFQWGKIYVIDSSQGVLVKRIFEDKENQESIILVSDNADKYPPFPFPKSDIRSISIVLGVIRLE